MANFVEKYFFVDDEPKEEANLAVFFVRTKRLCSVNSHNRLILLQIIVLYFVNIVEISARGFPTERS